MPVRISATDLREAGRKAASIRTDAAARGESAEILLDIEVVIEPTAATAFAATDPLVPGIPPALRYVGTPRGLAGLISDVRRLGIADGVVLVTPSGEHVAELMLAELAPGLGAGS